MKIRRIILALACLLIGWTCFAQEPSVTEDLVRDMVGKYENVKGVESNIFVKGEGLELVKTMMKKEFGKEFMKGVTCIIIMEYSEADNGTCMSIHNDIDSFSARLEEIDLRKMEIDQEGNYLRCFGHKTSEGNLSDFLVIIEDEESKMMMYMGGALYLE